MNYLCILTILLALSILLQHTEARKQSPRHPEKKRSHGIKYHKLSVNRDVGSKHVRITDVKHHSRYSSTACIITIDNNGMLSFQGGAVIISEFWAMTAAQVLIGFPGIDNIKKKIYVFANANDMVHPNDGIYRISKYFISNQKLDLDYDMALVKVRDMFVFKGLTFPLLPYRGEPKAGWHVHVAGWKIPSPGNISIVHARLHHTTVKLTDFKDCQEIYKSIGGKVTNGMICAPSHSNHTCASDAGGPLYYEDQLIGIVSWGAPGRCGNSMYPDVYTKVIAYNNWIRNVTKWN